jgi:hypothetical protein
MERPLTFNDVDAAERWIETTFAIWEASLTDAERSAITAYKATDAYIRINGELRAGTSSPGDARLIGALDTALHRFVLPTPVIVYRGWYQLPLFDQWRYLSGARISDRGYFSTSLLKAAAEGFITVTDYDAILARILLPAGVHAVHVATPDLVVQQHQAEILLPRGSVFRVTATHLQSQPAPRHILELELIP